MFGVIISKFMCGWKDVRCTFYDEEEKRSIKIVFTKSHDVNKDREKNAGGFRSCPAFFLYVISLFISWTYRDIYLIKR